MQRGLEGQRGWPRSHGRAGGAGSSASSGGSRASGGQSRGSGKAALSSPAAIASPRSGSEPSTLSLASPPDSALLAASAAAPGPATPPPSSADGSAADGCVAAAGEPAASPAAPSSAADSRSLGSVTPSTSFNDLDRTSGSGGASGGAAAVDLPALVQRLRAPRPSGQVAAWGWEQAARLGQGRRSLPAELVAALWAATEAAAGRYTPQVGGRARRWHC